MEMKTVKLADICDLSSSKRIFRSEYVPCGVPFYRSKEIIQRANGEIITEPLFISEERYKEIKDNYGVPHEGDILLTAVGTIGKIWIVDKTKFYFKDGNLIRLSNFVVEKIDPQFLYYKLLSKKCNAELSNLALGAAQSALTLDKLREFSIDIPNIEVQKKVAKTISAYDEMIDNCKRQIALLEEAAQRLYREWFVDLRFPGHESTPIGDNGLPEGWSRSTLRDFLSIKSGKDHKVLQSGNIPVYGSGGRMRYGDKAIYDKASILIPRKGSLNNILLVEGGFWTIDTMFYTEIKDENTIYFTYLQIKDWDLYAQNIGAAVPSMNTTILYSKEMIQPSIEIIGLFNSIIKPYYSQIFTLNHRLEYLIEAKGRLIPRLISGQIEINA